MAVCKCDIAGEERMKHEKAIRRTETVAEAVIFLWMVFYVEQYNDALGWPYPFWIRMMAVVAILFHIFCQWQIGKIEYQQKMFWFHLVFIYASIAVVLFAAPQMGVLGNLLVATILLVECWVAGYRYRKR